MLNFTIRMRTGKRWLLWPIAVLLAFPAAALSQQPDVSDSIRHQIRQSGQRPAEDLPKTAQPPQTNPPVAPAAEPATQPATEPAAEPTTVKRLRVPGVYSSIPSLRDLYSQVDQAHGPVERFGMSLFRGMAASGNEDLPVTSDYLLGPGDVVNLDVWGGANEHLTRLIDQEGRISIPDVGNIVLAHQTIAQAQNLVSTALRREFNEVRADISVARIRKVRIYVVGDVIRPGAYTLPGNSTVLNVLMAAGGPTEMGSLRKVRHLRGSQLVREIDLYDFMLHGVDSALEPFENGDTLVVPTIGAQVAILGAVRRPAIYELRKEHSLAQVLSLAGGVPVGGTLREIAVDRIVAHENRTTVTLRMPDGATAQQVEQQLDDFAVQDGDRVSIRSILPYREQTIYLEGHVFRPGKLEFHAGMTLGDVIHTYQDLLPEPSDHAEIVRLDPPSYRPTVLTFNLADVINHRGVPVRLQPFDTIRIFGRYEYDPPQVSIRGEVLRPGDYPLQEQMTAADLVRLAGGFKRSAYTQQADLARYEVEAGGKKILNEQREIAIGDALEGKPDTDVRLHAGDVLSIRQISGWSDVGATVSVDGEVRHPGSYGIEKDERLSSILRRAGGFRDTAYPAGAVLERVQVHEFAERSRDQLVSKLKLEAALANSNAGNSESKKDAVTMAQQSQQIESELMAQPVSGRLVISISRDIDKWKNTPADLEVRAGDRIFVPKRPEFVLVSGQVFNQSAMTFVPGKRASWYLRAAGGPTRHADLKSMFVIRANGQVVGQAGSKGFWSDRVQDTRMEPGDTLVIPSKVTSGTGAWKDFAQAAQVMSALAIAARVATSF